MTQDTAQFTHKFTGEDKEYIAEKEAEACLEFLSGFLDEGEYDKCIEGGKRSLEHFKGDNETAVAIHLLVGFANVEKAKKTKNEIEANECLISAMGNFERVIQATYECEKAFHFLLLIACNLKRYDYINGLIRNYGKYLPAQTLARALNDMPEAEAVNCAEAYKTAISKEPAKAFAKRILIITSLIAEKYSALAELYCREALKRDEDNKDVLIALGGSLFLQGKYNDALAIFNKILIMDPKDSEVLLMKANTVSVVCSKRIAEGNISENGLRILRGQMFDTLNDLDAIQNRKMNSNTKIRYNNTKKRLACLRDGIMEALEQREKYMLVNAQIGIGAEAGQHAANPAKTKTKI